MRSTPASALICVVCLFGYVASVLLLGHTLPPRVAAHFDWHGQADGWSSPAVHTRSFLLLAGFPALLVGLCSLLRFFPSWPLNVPNREYWRAPEHYLEACDLILAWAFRFAALTTVWLGFFHYLVVRANRLAPPALSSAGLALLTVLFLAATGIGIWALLQRFRQSPAP